MSKQSHSNANSPNTDWSGFLNTRGATIKDDIVVRFDQTPADYRKLLQSEALYDVGDCGVLALIGPDSAKFLQGQTTADFEQLTIETPVRGAFCNLQGRMICDFTALMPKAEQIFLIMTKTLVASVIAEVAKYAAFFKTELSDASNDYRILGLSGPNSAALMNTHYQMPEELISMTRPSGETLMSLRLPGATNTDDRALVSRYLLVVPMESAKHHWRELEQNARPLGLPCWHLLDIHAGLGHIYGQTSAAFIPQMLNYDMTGVVSFTKGCYTGQEIVARMQYRGKLKRRLYRLMLTTTAVPLPGTEIKTAHDSTRDNKVVGQVVVAAPSDADHVELLAVLSNAAVGDAGHTSEKASEQASENNTDNLNRVIQLSFADENFVHENNTDEKSAYESKEVTAQFLALPYNNADSSNNSADN